MTGRLAMKPVSVWLLLCGLTLLSIVVVETSSWTQASGVAVVVIAALKSRLVIRHYMEAAEAGRRWCQLYELWNFAVAATLIIGFLYGSHVS